MTDEISATIFSIISIICAALGVVMLAGAVDLGIRIFGLLLILFGLGFGFFLLKRHYDVRFGKH
jgi:uncharacterized Tic20 family protein